MDGVDRDHPALPQTRERRDHHVAARREGDGAIERTGGRSVSRPDPHRPQRFRQLAVRRAARRDVDLASPGPQHRNRQVRRRAEAEQPDPLAPLHARHAQAAKSDDAGAKQRRGVQVVQRIRQREHEVGAGQRVLGIAAVDLYPVKVGASQRFSMPRRQYGQVPSVPPIQETPTRAPLPTTSPTI